MEISRKIEPGKGERGFGFCVTQALKAAGYDVANLPEWVKSEDMPTVCKEVGLKYHGDGR